MYLLIIHKDKADHYLCDDLVLRPVGDIPSDMPQPKEFRTIEGCTSAYYGLGCSYIGFVYNKDTRAKYHIPT